MLLSLPAMLQIAGATTPMTSNWLMNTGVRRVTKTIKPIFSCPCKTIDVIPCVGALSSTCQQLIMEEQSR
jgi:hypothetical protein